MAYDFSRQVPYDILSSKALEDAWLQSQIFGGKWYGKANSNLYNQGCTERLSITDNLAAIQNQKESANYWAGILSGVDGSLKMYENGNGTIACQVYSLNRKIIYAAWARNFSALKPFFDA